MYKSFREIIALWGVTKLAKAVGAKHAAVAKWQHRDNIPAEWWVDVYFASLKLPINEKTGRHPHYVTTLEMAHIVQVKRITQQTQALLR